MNVLALGDEPAESLGVDVRALERRTFFACAAVVGAIVSVTGLIGFVGLVVPQALRRVVGPDLRVVLPALRSPAARRSSRAICSSACSSPTCTRPFPSAPSPRSSAVPSSSCSCVAPALRRT